MDYIAFSAKAPGSMMIMGEHAVLADKTALCAAVNYYATVHLSARSDTVIALSSNHFPPRQFSLGSFDIERPYDFVLATIKPYSEALPSGFNLHIHTDFLPTLGLGSSAAVTVATLSVLLQYCNLPDDKITMLHAARKIIRNVQGRGSGADVAASLFGGLVSYRQSDLAPRQLSRAQAPLLASYCGYKTPTALVIADILSRYEHRTDELSGLYDEIDCLTLETEAAWEKQDWVNVGRLMNAQFSLQQRLGISDPVLNHMMQVLQSEPTCYGAKISGSGLGDCAIALGNIFEHLFPSIQAPKAFSLPIMIDEKGCQK